MQVTVTEPVLALLLTAFALFVLWVIAYSAARAAIGDETRIPHFTAYALASPDAVAFTLANLGPAPAFRVAVSWDRLSQSPIAETPVLTAIEPFRWEIAAPAIAGEEPVQRFLLVQYGTSTWSGEKRKRWTIAVLVPSRLAVLARGVEAPPL